MIRPLLRVDDLHVQPAQNASGSVLTGVDLTVNAGEIHAIVGPNGSGTSTLGATLLGSSAFEVSSGSIEFQGDDITEWPTDERAKAGMFLAFRHPQPIPGVSVVQFLRQALSAQHGSDVSVIELRLAAVAWMQRLGMDSSSLDRHLDEGFPRSEQLRNQMLQMAVLAPDIAIVDWTGSHESTDDASIVARGIREIRAERPEMAVVLITDSVTDTQRLFDEITPDHVHLLVDGAIVATGGPELTARLDQDGFTAFRTTVAVKV